MSALVGNALLVSQIAAATNLIVTLEGAVAAGNALIKQAEAENREVTQAEVDALFGQDAEDLAALDAKLKALGA